MDTVRDEMNHSKNSSCPILNNIDDGQSGDLHFNLSPFENNRMRITGFTDFTGKIPDTHEKKQMTEQLVNHTRKMGQKWHRFNWHITSRVGWQG